MSYLEEKLFEVISFFYRSDTWHLKSSCSSINIKNFDITLVGINGIILPQGIKLDDSIKQIHNSINIPLSILKDKLSELNYPKAVVGPQSHPIINLSFKLNGVTKNFRVASRSITMSKISNFRDMGGYPTIDNRQIIWGQLFRSGHLGELSDADKQVLIEQRVNIVCDFRDISESKNVTSQLPKQIKIIPIPISPMSIINLFKKIDGKNISSMDIDNFMEKANIELAEDHCEKYKSMFDLLIENNSFSTLIHCSAGKDRTGFGAMLILAALGVSEKIFIKDYLYSNKYIDVDSEINRWVNIRKIKDQQGEEMQNFNELFKFDRDILKLILQVKKRYLQSAIDTINKNYDGMENYLISEIGLNDEKRRALKNLYLYPKINK